MFMVQSAPIQPTGKRWLQWMELREHVRIQN